MLAERGVLPLVRAGALPSLVAAVAGGPVRGSWWSHPRGKRIFALATALEETEGVLVAKLVEGKVCFVDPALVPAVLRLASEPKAQARRLAALSPTARALAEAVRTASLGRRRTPRAASLAHTRAKAAQAASAELAKGALSMDALPAGLDAEKKQLQRARGELEAALVVHVAQQHTERGAHTTVLQSWSRWAGAERMQAARALSIAEARALLSARLGGAACVLVD